MRCLPSNHQFKNQLKQLRFKRREQQETKDCEKNNNRINIALNTHLSMPTKLADGLGLRGVLLEEMFSPKYAPISGSSAPKI